MRYTLANDRWLNLAPSRGRASMKPTAGRGPAGPEGPPGPPDSHTHAIADLPVAADGEVSSTKLVRADDSRLGGGGGGSTLLARTVYSPAARTTFATTSTTPVDIDAANLSVTFTAPADGAVVVELSGHQYAPTGGNGVWSLRSGTTNVAGSSCITAASNANSRHMNKVHIVGLTPGGSYTWKWAHRTSNGTSTTFYCGAASDFTGTSLSGQAIMEVYSA